MSHFIKPINKQEQKKIMKKKKKEVLYARHATDKVFYLSDISLISFTYMWISWQKKKKKIYILVWEKGMCAHKFMKDNIHMSDAWDMR